MSDTVRWSPQVRAHFANMLSAPGSGPIGAVVGELAKGELTDASFDAIVSLNGVQREPSFRAQLLDLILGYLQYVLEDHAGLSPEDQEDVSSLRAHLKIADGEFMQRRPVEVATILNEQLERILDDGIVDGEEELRQVELQAAFGIGYDDYLAVTRRAIENAYEQLRSMADAGDPAASGKSQALEPLYRLATRQHRTLGRLY